MFLSFGKLTYRLLIIVLIAGQGHAQDDFCNKALSRGSLAGESSLAELRSMLDKSFAVERNDFKLPMLKPAVDHLRPVLEEIKLNNKEFDGQPSKPDVRSQAIDVLKLLNEITEKKFPYEETILLIRTTLKFISNGIYFSAGERKHHHEVAEIKKVLALINGVLAKGYFIIPAIKPLSIYDVNLMFSYGLLPAEVSIISGLTDGFWLTELMKLIHDLGHAMLILKAKNSDYKPSLGAKLRKLLAASAELTEKEDYSNNVLILDALHEDRRAQTSLKLLLSGKAKFNCGSFLKTYENDESTHPKLEREDCAKSIEFLNAHLKVSNL